MNFREILTAVCIIEKNDESEALCRDIDENIFMKSWKKSSYHKERGELLQLYSLLLNFEISY